MSEPGQELWGAIKEKWVWGLVVLVVVTLALMGMAHLIDDLLMLMAQWTHPGNRP